MPDEQPRSKSSKISGDRRTGKIVKRINYNPVQDPNAYESLIPPLGTAHPYITDLYFYDADFQPVDGKYADVILNYSWKKNGAYDIEPRTQLKQVPLETHPNYRLKWNYALVSSSQTAEPSWWNNAKSFSEIEGQSDYGDYSFIKDSSQKGDKNLIKDRIKKVNTYLYPTKQIVERWYYAEQEDAQKRIAAVGYNEEPIDDFGFKLRDGSTPGLGEWLLMSAPVTREGGYWVVRKTYELSEDIVTLNNGNQFLGWDSDIYTRTVQ